MHRIILSSVAYVTLTNFSLFFNKRHDFKEKNVLDIKHTCQVSLKLPDTFIILTIIQGDIINLHRQSYIAPVMPIKMQ
jgi:hypothetical protein